MTALPPNWSPINPVKLVEERIHRGETIREDERVRAQICVIGTGAGGAVAGLELARAGFDVVLLEEGPYLTGQDYARLSTLRSIKAVYRDAGFTFTMGAPNILVPFGKCVGGSTTINSGSAFRMEERTFASWKKLHALPGLEWNDLERHFDRVQERVHIEPVPEELMGENGRMMRTGAEALGLQGEVVTRNAHNCLGRGRCYLGCPENAKQATHVSYIPAALEAGARLYTSCKAGRVVVEGGRARGVEARAQGGGRVTIEADTVVVAAGAVFSPILLRQSGLLKRNRHAGAHLRIHPASRVIGMFDREIRGHAGVPQSYHVTGLMDQGIVPEGVFVPPALIAPAMPGMGRRHVDLMKRYASIGLLGYRIIDSGEGRVAGTVMGMPKMLYDLTPKDTGRIVDAMRLTAEILFATGAKKIYLPVFGRGEANSMDETNRLLAGPVAATDIEMSAYHPHGTLRMGVSEAEAVTRPDGSLFEAQGVWVADASLFPESSRVNPQITVMALASHVAERIAASKRA